MNVAPIVRKLSRLTLLFMALLISLAVSARVIVDTPMGDEICQVRSCFIDDPERALGFDPHTDQIVPALGDGNSPIVVCMHGFGDSKDNFSLRLVDSMQGCPRDQFVCFNFCDYRLRSGWMLPQLRYANLGQEPDARVVLFHIIKCFCNGHKNIVLFAHSRGCAATIRALDMLFDPYKYRKTWEDLGFLKNGSIQFGSAIRAIQQAIGHVYLARPLLDVREALLAAGRRVTGRYLAPVTALMLHGAARVFTRYTVLDEEPIVLFKRLVHQARFNFYVFFAPHDRVVGNAYDDLVATLAGDAANSSTLAVYNTGIDHIEVNDAANAVRAYLLSGL